MKKEDTFALKMYKTHPDVQLPAFATEGSACFDLAFQCHGKHKYIGWNEVNKGFERPTPKGQIFINPKERIMVPTGLIMDIPFGYSVRIHARSGLSLKHGIILANSESVIDSDYVEELHILLYNRSDVGLWMQNGDRIAQGELVKQLEYAIDETTVLPTQKTSRNGGLGSTGIVMGLGV